MVPHPTRWSIHIKTIVKTTKHSRNLQAGGFYRKIWQYICLLQLIISHHLLCRSLRMPAARVHLADVSTCQIRDTPIKIGERWRRSRGGVAVNQWGMLFKEYKDCDTHQDQDHGPWHTGQQNHGVYLVKSHQRSKITLPFANIKYLWEREGKMTRSNRWAGN